MKLNIKKIQDRLAQMERRPTWLAQKVGVSDPTVHSWLKGEFMPSYDNLKRISEALNLSWRGLVKNNNKK